MLCRLKEVILLNFKVGTILIRYVNNNLESLDDNMVQSIIMDMMDKGSLHGVETNQAGQWPRSREKRTYTKSLLGFQLQMQCPATEAQ